MHTLSDSIADELKRSTRHGCNPTYMMSYRSLQERLLPDPEDLPSRLSPGLEVRKSLASAINQYDGPCLFNGVTYECEVLRSAGLWLFGLWRQGLRPDARRDIVIKILKLDCNAVKFRKEGLEWQLVYLFADYLASSYSPNTVISTKNRSNVDPDPRMLNLRA